MDVLFLTVGRYDGIEAKSIYSDLLREFRNHGHNIYVVCANERRTQRGTELIEEKNAKVLRVKIGNITKTNFIEKGMSTLLIDYQYKQAIRTFFLDKEFDLVLYSTPPITLVNTIKHLKKKGNATTYLLLKDIFPQNAVDIGVMKKTGFKGFLYRYFRGKEKKLYEISDCIGCMSQANVDYVLRCNPEVPKERVGICPNSIEPIDRSLSKEERIQMRLKYEIPLDKKVFVYGGNLGKPQGIPFLIECLKSQINDKENFFLIVGDGTEYGKLQAFIDDQQPENIKLIRRIPKEDYDWMVAACDIGMVFLDYRFTIPNFPSRLLSYMQAKIPVLAVTDANTDIGEVITEGEFGWWCESKEIKAFESMMEEISKEKDLQLKGINGWRYLLENYTSEKTYFLIKEQLQV